MTRMMFLGSYLMWTIAAAMMRSHLPSPMHHRVRCLCFALYYMHVCDICFLPIGCGFINWTALDVAQMTRMTSICCPFLPSV